MVAAMEKLPSELIGEIFCRLPTKSLARSRAVCKSWYGFWEDQSFLMNYLARSRPQFILRTNSKIFSIEIVDIDADEPIIEIRDVKVDIPCSSLVHCDGLFLSGVWKKKQFAIWNPCLRQKRLIETNKFRFCGIGYDNVRPQNGYKIFGFDLCFDVSGNFYPRIVIYECKSDAFKFIDSPYKDWCVPELDSIISLSGNLYWISYHSPTREDFIRSFDFSKEMLKTFCPLPCGTGEDFGYTKVLTVFKGDRFSLLRQSYLTKKIDILVTRQKIDRNGDDVVWINLMTVAIPNFPSLQHKCLYSQPSYLVDDKNKRLFVSTCDETGRACIYVIKQHVAKKIPIDSVVDLWPSHLTYIPSFAPIPLLQGEQQGSQV